MLQGTCLGEALRALQAELSTDVSESEDEDESGGPDGNGEAGGDVDLEENDEDNGSPGPVDGPPVFSEVILAYRKGSFSIFPIVSIGPNHFLAPNYPCTSFQTLGEHIGQANLNDLVRYFLFHEQDPTYIGTPPLPLCPITTTLSKISVFHSATATFCAPSNPSGAGGLYHETIRCAPKWLSGDIIAPRRDCVILNIGSEEPGAWGVDVARVHLLFSFKVGDDTFSCALIHHFCKSFDEPDPDNGMWIVEPDYDRDGYCIMSVVHIDSIIRAAHLLPIFGSNSAVPREINFSHSLDVFTAFYVNKYIDYHAFETLF
jgi:hypothetical protein